MTRRKISFDNHPELPFEEWKQPVPPRHVYRNVYGSAVVDKMEDATVELKDRRLFYISLGSGSSGNSCYVGTLDAGIIIDAGVKAETIEQSLKENGIDMKNVVAVLLTHDHSDHVRYVYTLLRNHRHLQLYCTNRVLTGILMRHNISKRVKDFHRPIFKEIPFKTGRFEVTAFDVPHDGSDNMGFSIEFDGRLFVLATDLGDVTERARHYMSRANYLVIESNYDLQMLKNGRYPEYLKARIQTSRGHMDNLQTAKFLQEIIHPGLSHIFLCHLSKDNNTPAKALYAAKTALEGKGIKVGHATESIEDRQADVQLMALPRFDATRLFVFRPPMEAPNSL